MIRDAPTTAPGSDADSQSPDYLSYAPARRCCMHCFLALTDPETITAAEHRTALSLLLCSPALSQALLFPLTPSSASRSLRPMRQWSETRIKHAKARRFQMFY